MKIFAALYLFLFSISAFAQGSIGGNGGGIVDCEGKAPVVLDYHEALEAVKGKEADLLPIEKLSRDEFLKIILDRILKAEVRKKMRWTYSTYEPGISTYFEKIRSMLGDVDHWKAIPASRAYDEALAKPLPPGCKFVQAAITVKATTYATSDLTQKLSEGQKHVLELHEILYASLMGVISYDFVLTSVSVRYFIQTLLKKNVSYSELRLAWIQYFHPFETYEWKQGDLYRSDYPEHPNQFVGYSGVWALDLRKASSAEAAAADSECPKWLVVAPTIRSDGYVNEIWDQAGKTPRLEGKWMSGAAFNEPASALQFQDSIVFKGASQSCDYVRFDRMFLTSNEARTPWSRAYIHAKMLVQYYESKMNPSQGGLSDFPIQKISDFFNWPKVQ